MRLLGYIRVSRIGGREGEGYISPSVQREAIEGYARELEGTIGDWLTDEDYSGGTTDRPAFQRALGELESGSADGLVVFKVDRFARSVADGMRIVREIVDRGQVFASCTERIDPRTPEGRYMLASFLNNGELFLEQMKAGWWTSKRRAIARGVHIGPTPVGYLRERSKPLSPDPVLGPAMTALFDRAAAGRDGDTALARWMSERVPPEGRRPWQASEIRRWLSSRVYLGEVRYGELVNTEAHPPLTDPETFERCQREPRLQRKAHSRFLLSGLVRCAGCRYSMGGQTYGGHDGAKPVYRCTNRSCPEPAVILTRRLDGYVRKLAIDYAEGMAATRSPAGDLQSLDARLLEAEAELNAFAADLEARRMLGEDGWRSALAVRAAARDEARQARDVAYAQAEASSLVLGVRDLDWHRLRDFLRTTVRAVYVRRGRLAVAERCLVEFADHPDPFDLPGPHHSGPFEPIRF